MEHVRPVPSHPGQRDPYGHNPAGSQRREDEPQESELDIRQILATVWRGKWIIAVSILFVGVMGVLTATQQPPIYQASAKVMFDIPRANVEAGEAVVNTALGRNGLQNQIEVLRSASLIKRVIEDLRLDQNPVFNPSLRPPRETWRNRVTLPPEVEDIMLAWGLITPPGPPPDPEVVAERMERVIIENVLNGLRLRPVNDSDVIEIGYVSGNPRLSAQIVNAIADQYIVDQLEGKLETFRSGTSWLTERVAELQQRVEAAEASVLAAQARVAEEAGSSLDALNQQLATLTGALAATRGEVTQIQARYARLRDALQGGAEMGTISELRDSPIIANLRRRESTLKTEDDQLARAFPPTHPSREQNATEMASVRREMADEARLILESVRLDLETAQEREAQLARDVRRVEEQVLRLSTNSVEIRNLEREAQASRILYENLLSRLQETNAQRDLQTADARILTPAEPPLYPINSAKNRTLMTSLVVGAALGIGIVFLLDKLNSTFRSPQMVEQMTGQPVLATIPRAGSRMKRAEVVNLLRKKPTSALAESIRNLRTSILFSNVDNPPKVVMFSSSAPREGKSTTSMLVALTSRQMGKSAIIVDCDLRMPALLKVLEVSKGENEKPGLLSVINESAAIEDAIYVEPDTGLHVLMTRPAERAAKINAADVLASARFRALIEELRRRYDIVILDTPPTLVVTDARIVSALADAVVFAVRWDGTPRAAVKEGLRELTSVGARITGVVMTLVNEQRAASYAYDGYRYYKGLYRDYYES
ncbi:GumC family protein [Roseitranquillus sediminis]|uniref:GumC family protein n=1 Tax=Roseitranquillus sediminis TaxID=2809051 RepID=UPI001D0C8075|nr:polysaccharide biosynthesis tyrosine autokinase [Roseitranquillus sediminis]MBM9594029.1 polysaccharide biosynthesis tyrosine autokinase [Roseitranquillus sediminis]